MPADPSPRGTGPGPGVSDGLVKAEEGDKLRSLTAEVQRKLCNSLAYSGVSNVCTRLNVPINLKELEVG